MRLHDRVAPAGERPEASALQRVGRGDVHGGEVGGDARPEHAHRREVGRRLAANLHVQHLQVIGHRAFDRLPQRPALHLWPGRGCAERRASTAAKATGASCRGSAERWVRPHVQAQTVREEHERQHGRLKADDRREVGANA